LSFQLIAHTCYRNYPVTVNNRDAHIEPYLKMPFRIPFYRFMSRVLRSPRNTSDTLGSNCPPAYFLSSDTACSIPGEGLYGLSAMIASNVSAKWSILAQNGISSPLSPSG